MTEEEKFYISIGEQLGEQSQMFGKPCFKINKKSFVCFFENEMVFKLTGDTHKDAISLNGSKLFDPSGKNRPMKEWVQVSYDYKNKWLDFAIKAAKYIKNTK